MRLYWNPASPEVKALRAWHWKLCQQRMRGERARLRRAATIERAAMAPAFHDLLRSIEREIAESGSGVRIDERRLGDLAVVAALAAAAEEDDPSTSLGRALGQSKQGSAAPRVSPARFRRLVETVELGDRFHQLRRLLPLVEKRVNLAQLAAAVSDWTPRRRRQLAYDYYHTAPATLQETA